MKQLSACPECGGAFRFGSRDPCEGDYYWCSQCGAGPVLFPLYHKMPRLAVIDADIEQAAMGIRGAAAAIDSTIFKDTEPFDAEQAVNDIVGS